MAVYDYMFGTISTAQNSPWKHSMDLSIYPTVISSTLMTSTNGYTDNTGNFTSDGTITQYIGTSFSSAAGAISGTITGMQLLDATNGELLEEITDINYAGSDLSILIDQQIFIQTEMQNAGAALGINLQSLSSVGLPVLSPTMMVVTLSDGTQIRNHGTNMAFDPITMSPISGSFTGVDHYNPATNSVISSYMLSNPVDVSIFSSSNGLWDSLFSGVDTINGDEENNWIDGGTGNDIINGGDGYDMLIGGTGDDELTGGTGAADQFVFSNGWGHDTITDFVPGTDMLDFLNVTGVSNISNLTITDDGLGNALITFGADSITLMGFKFSV